MGLPLPFAGFSMLVLLVLGSLLSLSSLQLTRASPVLTSGLQHRVPGFPFTSIIQVQHGPCATATATSSTCGGTTFATSNLMWNNVPRGGQRSSGRRTGSKRQTLSVVQRLAAGGTSRALAQMTLYPIDALRTLAQTRDGRTLADVGTKALVRGCATTSSFALLIGSLQFAVFGYCRVQLQLPTIVSSALGAAASCMVGVPQEVIKQRLVTGVYSSFGSAVTTIWQSEGLKGFYSGWKPTFGRNVPNIMTTFTTMEIVRRRRLKNSNRSELSILENVLIGMGSAMVGCLLTQPFDVIKTRMMTQAASTEIPYLNALDCARTILRKEGPMTLYSGLKQRGTYMALLWGMTFALNGYFESAILKKRLQKQKATGTK